MLSSMPPRLWLCASLVLLCFFGCGRIDYELALQQTPTGVSNGGAPSFETRVDAGSELDASVRPLDAGLEVPMVSVTDAGPDAASSARPVLVVDYPDFQSTSGLSMTGAARQLGDQLELVPDETETSGGIYVTAPLSWSDSNRLEIKFSFRIINLTSSAADGMVLVLHNDARGVNSLGDRGGNLGYAGGGFKILPSVGIEFDVHQAGDVDPNDNHLAVLLDGNIMAAALQPMLPVELASGNSIFAWVDYAEGAEVEVYLADVDDKPAAPTLSHALSLQEQVGNQIFVGIVASTGAASSQHLIESLRIRQFAR